MVVVAVVAFRAARAEARSTVGRRAVLPELLKNFKFAHVSWDFFWDTIYRNKLVQEACAGDEKLYSCTKNFCHKTFSEQGHLNAHLMTHKKLYQCIECDERFAQLEKLGEHVKNHTGDKDSRLRHGFLLCFL